MKKRQHVKAILKEKRTVTVFGVIYEFEVPKIVDIKTARYLKNTGLFKFERIEEAEKKSKENVEV